MKNHDARETLDRILKSVPGWSTPPDDVTPLGGGITNRNYVVQRGQERFVVRVGGHNTELLGIDRVNECKTSRIVAELGIGAGVFAFVPEEGAMVTHFVTGQNVSAQRAVSPQVMNKIVRVIRCYHEGPDFPGSFSPFQTVRDYGRLAREHQVVLPERAGPAISRAEAIEEALGPVKTSKPCHNDLLAANFLEDGDTICLLDWEYAGMGDLFFDLGNFAANQTLDAAACQQLLEAYFGHVDPRDLAHLRLMQIVSDLRESFWGFLQSGISSLDFDFRAYAIEHLDRFIQKAAATEVDDWIRTCLTTQTD